MARLVASRIVQAHPPPTKDSPVTEDRGVLIFTSSTSYQDGQMGQAAYATSKAGVAGLVLPMARDLGRYGAHSSLSDFVSVSFQLTRVDDQAFE